MHSGAKRSGNFSDNGSPSKKRKKDNTQDATTDVDPSTSKQKKKALKKQKKIQSKSPNDPNITNPNNLKKDSCLLKELTSLTKNFGFDTNYGLCNSNYTDFYPFAIENLTKMNELKAINKSIPVFNLDLSVIVLQYSHQYFTTYDFLNILISYYNNNPNLIPENMREYHESIECIQQLNGIDLEAETKLVCGVTCDYLNKKILKSINEIKERQLRQKRENELKQELKNIDIEAEANNYFAGYYDLLKRMNSSDLEILKMIRRSNVNNNKKEEIKNINGLKDYIKKMEESEYELHWPLDFDYFSSHQIMHGMIIDHESIIKSNPCPDKKSKQRYDEFVENVNMLKNIVKFIQNNTSNSRIYSIPTFCGDGQYWSWLGDKYYGTVFVVGETLQGNLLGFYFDQNISI